PSAIRASCAEPRTVGNSSTPSFIARCYSGPRTTPAIRRRSALPPPAFYVVFDRASRAPASNRTDDFDRRRHDSRCEPPGRAAPAGLAFLRLADVDLSATDIATVQLGDRLARLARRAHLDEPEAARATAVAVGDDRRRFDRSGRGEQLLEILPGGREREVSDE